MRPRAGGRRDGGGWLFPQTLPRPLRLLKGRRSAFVVEPLETRAVGGHPNPNQLGFLETWREFSCSRPGGGGLGGGVFQDTALCYQRRDEPETLSCVHSGYTAPTGGVSGGSFARMLRENVYLKPCLLGLFFLLFLFPSST